MRKEKYIQALAVAALSAALVVPVAAQQSTPASDNTATTTSQQTQSTAAAAPQSEAQEPTGTPATATQQSSDSQAQTAAPTPTRQSPTQQQVEQRKLVPQTRQGFWGKVNPFARKKYVNGQLQPVRDRVNELDELTANNGRMINDVDRRTRAGIADAQSRANAANQTAQQAAQQAQQVSQRADQLNQQVTTVNSTLQNVDQYQVAQTAEVRFRPGMAKLTTTAQQQLDQFLNGLENQKGYLVEVNAFSSGRGEAAFENSQRLADSVVRYLVLQHNIPLYRIYTMSGGNTPVQATSSQANRAERTTRGGKVEIQILRNALSANNNAPASNPATGDNQQPPQQR